MMNTTLLFGMPGGMEWILILFAIILLFGGKKIPELARGLGQGIKEFRNAKNELVDKLEDKPKAFERPNKLN